MKTKFPSAVSLTQQQINWIRQQPNGSELIGKLIDALMTIDKFTPEAFNSVQLHLMLKRLKDNLYDVKSRRDKLLMDNKQHFKQIEITSGVYANFYVENPCDPTPTDDDGRIIKRLLVDYDESAKQMASEIQKITADLLQPAEQTNTK